MLNNIKNPNKIFQNGSLFLSKETFKSYIIFFGIFAFTLIISPLYVSGDQAAYNDFYQSSKGLNLIDTYQRQIVILGSADIGYSLIIWMVSDLISKNIFMSISNGILAVLVYKLTRSLDLPIWFFVGIIFSFYALVLFFAAERLKFAAIFICYAFLWRGLFSRSIILILASIFHLQAIIALLLVYLHSLSRKSFILNLFKIRNYFTSAIILSIILIFGFVAFDYFMTKLLDYLSFDPINLIKPFILGIILILCLKDKLYAFLISFSFILACLIIGTDRIIMVQFIITLFLLNHRNPFDMSILLILFFYLFIKSIEFVTKIAICGEGFLCQIY